MAFKLFCIQMLLLLPALAFGQVEPWPADIKVVNFVSGVPLVGLGDTNGGFGDVAANLQMAIEYKEANPKAEVNFLVTSLPVAQQGVRTTNEIMEIMVNSPGKPKALDSSIKGVRQKYQGVNFIFLDFNPYQLMYGNKLNRAEINYLRRTIPNADLTIQMSANGSPMLAALQIDSKFAISFYEPTGSARLVETVYSGSKTRSPVIALQSGADAAGYYIDNHALNPAQSRLVATQWLSESGHGIMDAYAKLAVAYTKEGVAAQMYADAIAKLAKRSANEQFVLVIKDFKDLDLKSLPSNVKPVRIGGTPDYVMRALISSANVSPMVTGDVSISLALSHTTESKTVFYEAPPWKVGASKLIQDDLVRESPKNKDRIPFLFFNANEMTNWNEADRKARVDAMVEVLEDSNFQREIHEAIQKNRNAWDILKNIEAVYQLARLFQTELSHKDARVFRDLFSLIFETLFLKSPAERVSWAKSRLRGYDTSPENALSELKVDRIAAGLFLLKAGESLSPQQARLFLKAAADLSSTDLFDFLILNRERPNFRDLIDVAYRMRNEGVRAMIREVLPEPLPRGTAGICRKLVVN